MGDGLDLRARGDKLLRDPVFVALRLERLVVDLPVSDKRLRVGPGQAAKLRRAFAGGLGRLLLDRTV